MPKPVLPLNRAKQHLRVEHELDDDLITAFCAAAVDHVLDVIGLAGVLDDPVTLECYGDAFTMSGKPVHSITGIERWDGAAWQAVPEEGFSLTGNHDIGYKLTITGGPALHRVVLAYGFQALPSTLEMAMLFLVAHFYENRGAVTVGAGVAAIELPLGVKALLNPWRRILFA